ncbi:MAG TPA: hypothetical protein VGR38_02030, partial [Candidatus Polarisedimenticolia bacterium]|nr:hypothetical protein [Candidatus Polarisedimenticolia bacterium]
IQSGYFPREITSLNVDTLEMLLDEIRDLPDRSFVLLEVGAPDTVYVSTGAAGNGTGGIRLPRGWREFADRFKDPLAIREFGQASGMDDFSASKVVYGLSLLGCVAPKGQEEQGQDEASAPSAQAVEVPVILAPPPTEIETQASPTLPSVPAPPPRSVEDHQPEAIPDFRQRFDHSGTEGVQPIEEPAAEEEEEPASPPQREDAASLMDTETLDPTSAEESRHVASVSREFKGPFTSSLPPAAPSRSWSMLSVFGGFLLLAVGSYWFVFLRAPAPAGGTTVSPPAQEDVKPPEPRPLENDASESDSGPPAPSSKQEESPLPPSPGDAAGESPAAQDASAEEAPGEPPAQIPPSKAPPAQPSEPTAAESFRKARAHLDAGEFAAAGRSWAKVLSPEAATGFTLQIAIACHDDSLRKAAARTDPAGRLFVLPFALQERACYRLCWGIYPSLEEAQSGRSSIPGFFLEQGGRPVVVSLRQAIPQAEE